MGTVLSWLLLLPWLLILPFDKMKVKPFLSVVFLCCIITIIYFQIADYLDWWVVHPVFPALGNIPSFALGLSPAVTLLIFYFTFPNVWLFFLVNLVMDAFQVYVIGPYVFEKAGLYTMTGMSDTGLYLVLTSIVPLIYLYQLWYDWGRYTKEDIVGFPHWAAIKEKAR